MKNIYHIFYAVNYWITTAIFRNKKDEPEFATTISVTLFVFLFLITLLDMVFFHFFHNREIVINKLNKNVYFIIITIILIFNYKYFSSIKIKKILREFENLENYKKHIYKIIIVCFELLILLGAFFTAQSISDNYFWF